MDRKRLLMLVLVLALVIAAAAGSWYLGSRIQSPAEAAARTAPPTPSPILVPVEKQVLTADIVSRGTARFGQPQSIALAPSALKLDTGIITSLPSPGSQIEEGDVLFTASGRPVFVFQGQTPAYRDLTPGIHGPDVRQLEESLARLGLDPGPVDGRYDEATSAAVADWYGGVGFEPLEATAAQVDRIRVLTSELTVADSEKTAADEALAAAPLAVNAARAEAEAANLAAAAEVDTAVTDQQREATLAAATAAQLTGEVAVQAALDAQAAAAREAQRAADAVGQITRDLRTALRDGAVKVPLDEIVFLPALPVRVEALHVAIGDAASGPVMTVTNNQLAIDASAPLDEAPLVKPGQAVAIDEPDLGLAATGQVSRVATTPGTEGVDGFHIYFEVLVDETPLTLDGFSLRLTIPVESTGGEVLTVPISALSLAADGRSRVQVDGDSGLEYVVVEPGLSASGYVEVTPIDGRLEPGQLVVIGFENP
jgi:peptidoglycan hydrolase-like protein with peptidoglycan-binding domain